MGTFLALLGFLPDTELRLKTLIQEHLEGNIDWVTATDTKLQGVVINADFISSPQIQNYIGRTKANIVCAYCDEDGKKQSENHNILGLFLSQHSDQELKNWMQKLCGSEASLIFSEQVSRESPHVVASSSSSSSVSPAPSETISPVKEEPPLAKPKSSFFHSKPKTRETATDTTGMSDNHEQFLKAIQNIQGYYFAQYGDRSVWINTQKSEVYLDFDRDQIQGIESIRWKPVPEMEPPRSARRLQLELWLFETLWQSARSLPLNQIDENGLYKLVRWPRPLCPSGRSEALRLAAFIQATPASISLLSNKTSYEPSMVKRFLHAGLLSGQIKQTGTASTHEDHSHEVKKVDREKLGLLKRIRVKLGL